MKITRKKLLIAAQLLFAVSFLHAQISVAPKVGLSYSTFAGDFKRTRLMPGTYFGGMVNMKAHELLSFQSGLLISGKGTTLRYTEVDDDQMLISYLEMPFNTLLTLQGGAGKLQVFTGPYLGFALGGRYKYLEDENEMMEKLLIGTSESDEIKPFDAGLSFGVGFLFEGFEIQGAFSRSLTNISNLPADKAYNRVVTVSMAYYFVLNPNSNQRR